MSMKDAPSPEDGTTGESNNNEPTALDFVENLTAYAITHDAYKVFPMPNFEQECYFGAELEGKNVDYEESFSLPAEVRGDVMFIRVGQLLPSERSLVIATTERGFDSLIDEGFVYEHDGFTLQTSENILEYEVGYLPDSKGDA